MSKSAAPRRKTSDALDVAPAVLDAARAALSKKAHDVLALDLTNIATFTDAFLICSGQNTRQVKAIADAVWDALAEQKIKPIHTEGYERAEWILLDYVDFVVHVFTPDMRLFYALEKLWGSAKRAHIED